MGQSRSPLSLAFATTIGQLTTSQAQALASASAADAIEVANRDVLPLLMTRSNLAEVDDGRVW
jgi:hypothetical protein